MCVCSCSRLNVTLKIAPWTTVTGRSSSWKLTHSAGLYSVNNTTPSTFHTVLLPSPSFAQTLSLFFSSWSLNHWPFYSLFPQRVSDTLQSVLHTTSLGTQSLGSVAIFYYSTFILVLHLQETPIPLNLFILTVLLVPAIFYSSFLLIQIHTHIHSTGIKSVMALFMRKWLEIIVGFLQRTLVQQKKLILRL